MTAMTTSGCRKRHPRRATTRALAPEVLAWL